MGLHLGWIPNEPGLRAREYDRAAPSEPAPDPATLAALRAAQHARGLWSRLLIVVGLFGLALFGLLGYFGRVPWAWGVAVGLALCCWLTVLRLALVRRRAAGRLRRETAELTVRHAAELDHYERDRARWDQAEIERVATAPRWLRVSAHEDTGRLDVFGGTIAGRGNMLTGLGWELLEQRAVIVLDLSADRVAGGLIAAAAQAGIAWQEYELPRDLAATPLLTGLSGDEIASLIVEVLHADDANATAAGRATDLLILRKIARVLGADVSMGRLHAALAFLIADEGLIAGEVPAASPLSAAERAGLDGQFGAGLRLQLAGNLVRLAAVVEPLAGLGSAAVQRPPARLTCLSLADGPRDVAADLTAALIVQWVTRAVAGDGGFRPAVVLAGADEQSTRHLSRLAAVCERYQAPLVRVFSRLTEESARHLDTRHTAFMRLATRPEALRAAEHLGLERRFVAGRFSHRHSVSRSRTKTTSDSVTHTSGTAEGEAVTRSTGTTTGQAYSEAEVPRRDQHITIENHNHVDARSGNREASGRGDEPGQGQRKNSPEQQSGGRRGGGGQGNSAAPARPRTSIRLGGGKGGGRPQMDIVRTRTRFTMRHESEAKTQSLTRTEEVGHTTSTSVSRTDGVSVGDEITYELVYDHKVHPETLMALPEEQMLAPHIVSGTAVSATMGGPGPVTESRIVALVVDPAVVGAAAVAPVRPDEIPVFEPPAPAVSAHVPDYQRVPRPAAAISRGMDIDDRPYRPRPVWRESDDTGPAE